MSIAYAKKLPMWRLAARGGRFRRRVPEKD